jgi:hypothetical protein
VGNQKCDIDKVEEDWFQVVEWHWEHIICLLYFAKCDFGKSIKRNIKWWKSPKNSFPAFCPPQITTWLKSIKQCFMVSTQPARGLSALWQTKNETLAISSKRCFKCRMALEIQYLPSGCPKKRRVKSKERCF